MFSTQTLDFLSLNHVNNDKEWFHAHKNEFEEYVRGPMTELFRRLMPAISKIDGMIICDPKQNGSFSRIYRDVRFSNDKSLYRDHMWLMFSRDKKANPYAAEFFFVFSQTGFFYGCGYYAMPADTMNAVREMVLANHPAFDKALSAYNGQNIFEISGDMYKRSRYPDENKEKRIWLERKNLCFIHNSTDFNLFFSDELWERLSADFTALSPVYDFFLTAEESSRKNKV